MFKKGKSKKRKKQIIEIKTRAKGWHRVQLLKIKNNGMLLIRLPSGEVINRHISKSTKWGKVVKKPLNKPNKKDLKYLRSKKKRRRGRKSRKIYKKRYSNKWK